MTANELLEVELGIEVREYSHPSGAFSYRERYKNGEPEGMWEEWYKSGALKSRGTYRDGEVDGVWEEWCESGALMLRELWKDGELVSQESFDDAS